MQYAAQMRKFAASKSRPYLWLPATRARVFILARLKSRSAFVHVFAKLCVAQGDIGEQNRLHMFVPNLLAWLDAHKKQGWDAGAVAAAVSDKKLLPGKVGVALITRRLDGLRSDKSRRVLLRAAIQRANLAIAKQAKTGADKQQFRAAIEQFRFLRVQATDSYVTSLPRLMADTRRYLALYSIYGKHSPAVYYDGMYGIIHAYGIARLPGVKARILQDGASLALWHKKFLGRAPKNWKTPLATVWAQWQAIEHHAAPPQR